MTQSTISRQRNLPAFSDARRNSPAEVEPQPAWDQLVAEFAFVLPKAVAPHLRAASKQEAIEVLVDLLVNAGGIPSESRDELLAAVLRREELASTGFGEGVAIPHAKHAGVSQVVGALGYCPDGLDFASLDGRPVHLIVLVVSPAGDSRAHLLALEAASRRISDPRWTAWRNGAAAPNS